MQSAGITRGGVEFPMDRGKWSCAYRRPPSLEMEHKVLGVETVGRFAASMTIKMTLGEGLYSGKANDYVMETSKAKSKCKGERNMGGMI